MELFFHKITKHQARDLIVMIYEFMEHYKRESFSVENDIVLDVCKRLRKELRHFTKVHHTNMIEFIFYSYQYLVMIKVFMHSGVNRFFTGLVEDLLVSTKARFPQHELTLEKGKITLVHKKAG